MQTTEVRISPGQSVYVARAFLENKETKKEEAEPLLATAVLARLEQLFLELEAPPFSIESEPFAVRYSLEQLQTLFSFDSESNQPPLLTPYHLEVMMALVGVLNEYFRVNPEHIHLSPEIRTGVVSLQSKVTTLTQFSPHLLQFMERVAGSSYPSAPEQHLRDQLFIQYEFYLDDLKLAQDYLAEINLSQLGQTST
jgi:hypothetical protein